ncbi:MAG: hypothetical protein ABSG76_21485 [Xanthobacteraceae bacterium]
MTSSAWSGRAGLAAPHRDAYVYRMSERSTYEPKGHGEPEIIPPGEPIHLRGRGERWIWVSAGTHSREIRFRKPGLLGIVTAALVAGLAIAVVLAFVVSLVLIWIPIVGLILAGLVLSGALRGWRRPRR